MGFAREFLRGLKTAAEASSGGRPGSTSCLSSREARSSRGRRAKGARGPHRARSPHCIPWSAPGGHRTVAWRGSWEPLGDAKKGEVRVCAQQKREELQRAGVERVREASSHIAGERGTGGVQERPGERPGALEKRGLESAGESQGEGAGIGRSGKELLPQRERAKARGQGSRRGHGESLGNPQRVAEAAPWAQQREKGL